MESICPNNEGLAIQTTYKKLFQSLPDQNRLFIGKVTYVDYETEVFSTWNSFNPIMHKRIAFENEKEVRIVKPEANYMNDHLIPVPSPGIKVTTTLLKKIESIYVNPYADKWYYETIQSLFNRLKIKIRLEWSGLKSEIYY